MGSAFLSAGAGRPAGSPWTATEPRQRAVTRHHPCRVRPFPATIVTPFGRTHPRLGGWSHDLAASQHRADRRGPLRRARRRRRHQRCRLGRGPRRPRRVGGPHRPRRLRRLHQPGVVEPGVGRLQVPRELRAAAGVQAVPLPQPADEGLPRQHQGDRLPRHPRPHRALPAVVRGARGVGYWGIGQFGTKPPAPASTPSTIEEDEPVIDTSTVRGGIEYHDAYLIDNDSRFVFSFVRSAIEAGAAAANYVELVSAERVGDRWVGRLRDVDSGEEFTTTARVIVNAAGPFVDELNTSWGADDRPPHRLLEGHPPRRAAAHDDPARPRARVLRRHPAAVLRHPDGAPLGHRHHRHPHRHAVHPRHRRGPRVPARPDQRPPRPAPAAHRRRRHRRALRRAAAGGAAPRAATSRTPTGPR